MCESTLNTGAIAITSGLYSDPEVSPLVTNVECSGEESGLLDCNYTTDSQSSCSQTEDAGVVCQGGILMACMLMHAQHGIPYVLRTIGL